MKKVPRLHLVTNGAESAGGESSPAEAELQFVSLGELGSAERTRVERLLAEVCPNAGVLAIALSNRVWDVRPIVAISGEGGPSIIRLLGPEVTLDLQISERVKEALVQLKKYSDLSSKLLAWGTFEGQLWYRRSFIDRTLYDILVDGLPQSNDIVQLFGIAFNLIDEVANWHSRGVIHGHITLTNVHIGPDGGLDLIDAAIGGAIVQATKKLGIEEFPAGYSKETFAGELLAGADSSAAVDIFGLGTVLRRILGRIRELQESSNLQIFAPQDLRSLTDLTGAMMVKDAGRRPALGKVKRAFGEKGRVLYGTAAQKSPQAAIERDNQPADEPASPQGTILSRGSSADRRRPILSEGTQTPPSGRLVTAGARPQDEQRHPERSRSDEVLRNEPRPGFESGRSEGRAESREQNRPENRAEGRSENKPDSHLEGRRDNRRPERQDGRPDERDRKDTALTGRREDLRTDDGRSRDPERKNRRDDRREERRERRDENRDDRTRNDRSALDRRAGDRPNEDRPSVDRSSVDRPNVDRRSDDRRGDDRRGDDRRGDDRRGDDRRGDDRRSEDRRGDDRRAADGRENRRDSRRDDRRDDRDRRNEDARPAGRRSGEEQTEGKRGLEGRAEGDRSSEDRRSDDRRRDSRRDDDRTSVRDDRRNADRRTDNRRGPNQPVQGESSSDRAPQGQSADEPTLAQRITVTRTSSPVAGEIAPGIGRVEHKLDEPGRSEPIRSEAGRTGYKAEALEKNPVSPAAPLLTGLQQTEQTKPEPPVQPRFEAKPAPVEQPKALEPSAPRGPAASAAGNRIRLGQVAPSPSRARQPEAQPEVQPKADKTGGAGDPHSDERPFSLGGIEQPVKNSLHVSETMPHILGSQFGSTDARTSNDRRSERGSSGSFIGFSESQESSPIGGLSHETPPADIFSRRSEQQDDFRSAYESYDSDSHEEYHLKKPKKGGSAFSNLIAGALLLAGIGFVMMTIRPWGSQGSRLDPAQTGQMEITWSSHTPSGMIPVVLSAIDRENPNQVAQMLILKSVMTGEQNLPGVNIRLLRIAFDPRWEASLTPSDRRTAISLASASLLGSRMPADLTLDNLHPGVMLSIAANIEGGSPVLGLIPADALSSLPLPFGPAFQEMLPEGKNIKLTAKDDAIRLLARFGTRGIEDSQDLAHFLSTDTERRLRALALIYSQDSVAARQVLDILINHPNITIQHDYVKWAKKWNVLNWSELENSDQLFVAAGMRPSKIPAAPNLAVLFTHPANNLRAYAFSAAIDNFKFDHPGAVEVLTMLRNNPDMLSAEETGTLANFLESPDGASKKQVLGWLAANPSIELVSKLLLSTAAAEKAEPMDPYLTRYLFQKGWKPELSDLRKLTTHPDRYTRLYSYSKVFELADHQIAAAILSDAKKKESDPQWLTRLDEMLGVLKDGSAEVK